MIRALHGLAFLAACGAAGFLLAHHPASPHPEQSGVAIGLFVGLAIRHAIACAQSPRT